MHRSLTIMRHQCPSVALKVRGNRLLMPNIFFCRYYTMLPTSLERHDFHANRIPRSFGVLTKKWEKNEVFHDLKKYRQSMYAMMLKYISHIYLYHCDSNRHPNNNWQVALQLILQTIQTPLKETNKTNSSKRPNHTLTSLSRRHNSQSARGSSPFACVSCHFLIRWIYSMSGEVR